MFSLLEAAVLVGALLVGLRIVIRYRRARPDAKDRWEPAALLGMASFASFFAIGLLIGGFSMFGKADGSHYFVGNHGVLRAVPHWVWLYSWIHAVSQLLTFPFILVGGFVNQETIEDEKGGSPDIRGRGAV